MATVNCLKLKKESEALDYQPYPGDIGKKNNGEYFCGSLANVDGAPDNVDK